MIKSPIFQPNQFHNTMSDANRLTRNIRVFYVHRALVGLANFWAPVIVLFQMQALGLSLTEVLLGESVFAATILLFEVPSGVLADRLGRKRTLIAGAVFMASGIIVFALAQSFTHVLLTQALCGIGMAFQSGADSALLFDSLKLLGREKEFRKVLGQTQTVTYLIAIPITMSSGLISDWFGLRFAVTLTAAISCLYLVNFLFLTEPTEQSEGRRPGKTMLWHTWKALRYIWKHRLVRLTVAFSMALAVGMKLSFHTLNPYWELWEVPVAYFGFAFAGYNLMAATSAQLAYRVTNKLGDAGTLMAVLLVVCGTFGLMALLPVGMLGALLLPVVFQIPRTILPIATGDMINRVTFSHHRATVLSMKSFLGQTSQLLLLPVFGVIADASGLLSAYGWTAGWIFLLGGLALYRLASIPAGYTHGHYSRHLQPEETSGAEVEGVGEDIPDAAATMTSETDLPQQTPAAPEADLPDETPGGEKG